MEMIFNIEEKPSWERMEAFMKALPEQEQRTLLGVVIGYQLCQQQTQKMQRDDNQIA